MFLTHGIVGLQNYSVLNLESPATVVCYYYAGNFNEIENYPLISPFTEM